MTPDRWTARPKGASFAQRQVRARLIVIRRIRSKHSPQVRLTKDQQSVQALAAHGADQAFRIASLPRRSRRDLSVADTAKRVQIPATRKFRSSHKRLNPGQHRLGGAGFL